MLNRKLWTFMCLAYCITLLPFLVKGNDHPEIVVQPIVDLAMSDNKEPGKRQLLGDMVNITDHSRVLPFKAIKYDSIKDKGETNDGDPQFEIGLSMYSLRDLFNDGHLHVLEFPKFAKDSFGITNIDIYDGGIPENRRRDPEMYKEIKREADKVGVNIFLLMADVLNADGLPTESNKMEMEKFYEQVDFSVLLGAKYMRIFLKAPNEKQNKAIKKSIEALLPLVNYAKSRGIIILIEPGGSPLSNKGTFLAKLAKKMDDPACRLMPDFGKMINDDPYGGTIAMMPYTEAVSAKTHDIDVNGNPVDLDYPRLMKIIEKSGFRGIIAIEYEGSNLPQVQGVRATKKLLE